MAILKPQTNIPLDLGAVKYADYAEGQYGAQLRLKNEGGDLVFLPLDTANLLTEAGVLSTAGTDENGKPKWKVNGRPRLIYTRGEKGKRPSISVDGQPIGAEHPDPTHRSNGHRAPRLTWPTLEATYRHCLAIAFRTVGKLPNATVADIQAGAATVFIQAQKADLVVAADEEGA